MKKYFALLLIIISCLFVFCGCKNDSFVAVESETVKLVAEKLYTSDIGARYDLLYSTDNKFPCLILVECSAYDNSNNFITKCYGCSTINSNSNLDKNALTISIILYQPVAKIIIDKTTVMKVPLDNKYFGF